MIPEIALGIILGATLVTGLWIRNLQSLVRTKNAIDMEIDHLIKQLQIGGEAC